MAGKRARRVGAGVALGLAAVPAGAFGGYVWHTMTYAEREARAVARAGYAEKRTTIDGRAVNYAEGPDNGPALLLIHGQITDWRGWSRVLPRLARHYHVFAVDCYGHGGSAHAPETYTANALAAGMVAFLDRVVGRPATIAGHSSGGLIAAGVAAAAPHRVRGLVLEDPPLFATLLPRAKETFNYVTLATLAHEFLADGATDFTDYYLRNAVIWELFGGAADAVKNTAQRYRRRHPGAPVKIFFMPPVLNELFRALGSYDPRFGDAFYTGSFDAGFDHAETLSRITAPVAQIHVKPRYDDAGILQAAMSEPEARRTRSLLHDVRLYRADTGHNFHFEKPDRFVDIVRELSART